MKAERRHELKENDLAHALEVARKYLDEHGKRIGIAVVIVAAVVAATALTVRSQTAAMEDNWRRKGELSFEDPEVGRESLAALAAMVQQASDERFILAALIEQGRQALRLAQKVPAGPDPEFNERAREAFLQLRTRFGDNPLAIGIAHLGLATVAENEFVLDGDLAHKTEAMKHLAAVVDDPALDLMPFKRTAMDRMAALNETFTQVDFEYPAPPDTPAAGEPMDTDTDDTP